jgi:chemotaxis protein MotB
MSHSKSRRRHAQHEEHENHERWLVTYADMVTLLMVLFIVMFAMSVVDEKKFNALKAGLAAGFGQSTSILDGSDSLLEEPGMSVAAPIAPNQLADTLPGASKEAVNAAVQKYDKLRQDRQASAARAEADRLDKIRRRLLAALAAKGLQDDVRMVIDERGLVVSLVSRHVVFEPNVAELSSRGREVVDTLAPVLRVLKDPLSIDGHTNQVKVRPKFFPTDWELSAARAVRVLRYLHDEGDVPASRMTASAFGHEKPLVDPSKPGSQAVNKRVDIVVNSPLSSDTRALLAQAAETDHELPGGSTS